MRKTVALLLILLTCAWMAEGFIRLGPSGIVRLAEGGRLVIASATPVYVPVGGDVTATMTGYTSPSPNIVTSYQNYGGAYFGWQAFDGDTGTRWQGSTNAPGPYIVYDWGTGTTKIIKKIRLLNRNVSNDVKQFWFQGSNDGSSYTTILIATATKSASWQTFATGNTTAYQMYRMYPQSTDGGAGYAPALVELEYWEME